MRLPLSCAFVLVGLASLPAAGPPRRVDVHGDPLPEGAVARLGSLRLRHPGLWDFVCLPDGKTVVTAGSDRVSRYWDLATGKQVRQVAMQGRGVVPRLVTLSPDGKTLVGQVNNAFHFWEVETGKEVTSVAVPKTGIAYLYFSPDGNTLAVGRPDPHVSLYDWKAGKQRDLALPVTPRPAGMGMGYDSSTHGVFSHDGKWFAAGANSREPLGVYKREDGAMKEVHRLKCAATASTFSADSKTLAVVSRENDKGGPETVVRLFDVATGKERKQFALGQLGHYYWINLSADGKRLVLSYSEDVRILDAETGKVLHRFPTRTVMSFFSKDGTKLLSNATNRLRCWDVATGKDLNDRPGDFGWQPTAAWSPDGRLLATADGGETVVRLWEPATGRQLRALPLAGGGRSAGSLKFSTDGTTLHAGVRQGFVQSWDVATGKERGTVALEDPGRAARGDVYFNDMQVSPDGKRAATIDFHWGAGGSSTRIALWDVAGKRVRAEHVFPGQAAARAWRADVQGGAYLDGSTLTQVDLESGARLAGVPGIRSNLLAFSQDDQLLLGNVGARVVAWEASTGKEAGSVNVGQVTRLALVPGNRFVVTTDGGYLRVSDLATGKELLHYEISALTAASRGELFVSPDARRALAFGEDGTALIWDLTPATARRGFVRKAVEAKTLGEWWADLASDDARRAYAAAWRFADLPERDAVGYLRRNLRPAEVANAKLIRKHIEDLDSDTFAVREKAQQALEELGHAAVSEMRAALEKDPPLEVKRRLEKLVSKAGRVPTTPEGRRQQRALQVLEAFGTKEARGLLETLAKGAPHAPLTIAAATTLQRVSHRSSPP